VGDGTGDLIEDLILQYKHFLLNWLLGGSYFSGAWLPSPTFDYFPGGFEVCLVNTDSFITANEQSEVYMGGSPAGGFKGAFVLGPEGRRTTVRQVLADFNLSANVSLGWNQYSQLFVKMLDRNRTTFLGDTETVHWRRHSLKDPARTTVKNRDWMANLLLGQYGFNYRTSLYESDLSLIHSASQARLGREIVLRRAYPFIRDQATAEVVAQQHLDFIGVAPKLYEWAESLCGLKKDILSGVPITDYNGQGSTGYVNRAMWIQDQVVNTEANTVTFTAFDVDDLLSET